MSKTGLVQDTNIRSQYSLLNTLSLLNSKDNKAKELWDKATPQEKNSIIQKLLTFINTTKNNDGELDVLITGSGKTEVYKKLITTAMAQNKSVILLLPEVTLATQFGTYLNGDAVAVTVILGVAIL